MTSEQQQQWPFVWVYGLVVVHRFDCTLINMSWSQYNVFYIFNLLTFCMAPTIKIIFKFIQFSCKYLSVTNLKLFWATLRIFLISPFLLILQYPKSDRTHCFVVKWTSRWKIRSKNATTVEKYQGSISSTFYIQLLRSQILKA